MNEIVLTVCTPEPLMSYLKALGVFRLVGEQKDRSAKLSWHNGIAVLHTALDREALLRFFVEEYQPTPILAPWNGGSGFYGGGSKPLNAIAESTAQRLMLYRETIAVIREFIPASKPKDDDKASLLIKCRSRLADEVVPWLDTCFALGEDGPGYSPLLGTGGNDGRLDFTNNFMQRVADVISFDHGESPDQSAGNLAASLFADTLVSLDSSAIGQFNPGGVGGANGMQGKFEAGSRVNPWDFVLMIEGAILFAGSVARRLGTLGITKAVFPFTVESVAAGYGSATASEETTGGSRAELWLPLWEEPTSLPELRQLFAEGRAQLGRRQAKNAVEFALAANLLGVSRGVTAFFRYGILKRNGSSFLATPLGIQLVQLRPDTRLLDDPPMVVWIDRLRRATSDKVKTPDRYQTALRNIDRAMFAFANRSEQGNDSHYLLDMLRAVGRAERTLASGLRFSQEFFLRPLYDLSRQWLEKANDRSVEFRLAATLAGIQPSQKHEVGPIRVFLEAVETSPFPKWSPGTTTAVWSNRSLAENLAAVFRRRQMEAFRAGLASVPLSSSRFARLDDVLAFLNRETNDEKINDLVWGLIGVEYQKEPTSPKQSERDVPSEFGEEGFGDEYAEGPNVPLEFGLPRLLVEERSIHANGKFWKIGDGEVNAKPDPDLFHLLASDQRDAISRCITRAARRLKSGGLLITGYRNRAASGRELQVLSEFSPVRLLAAMLFPLCDSDLERIANAVLFPPETED